MLLFHPPDHHAGPAGPACRRFFWSPRPPVSAFLSRGSDIPMILVGETDLQSCGSCNSWVPSMCQKSPTIALTWTHRPRWSALQNGSPWIRHLPGLCGRGTPRRGWSDGRLFLALLSKLSGPGFLASKAIRARFLDCLK